jgi:hypothetical protein
MIDADYQMPVQTCSLLYRRQIWEREPFPSEYRMAGDHVWIRRQFNRGWILASQREPIGIFTWHPEQLAPRHIGGKRENPTPDVNRKSFTIKLAKLLYRLRSLMNGSTFPPPTLCFETITFSGFTESHRIHRPRIKMPKAKKRFLALSRN